MSTNREVKDLQWPYVMQPHPDDPDKLGSQQILEKCLSPQAPYTRIGFGGPKGGGKTMFYKDLVELSNGNVKRISDIKKGDSVLSLNEITGKIEPRHVTELFTSPKKKFLDIRTKTGMRIRCAVTHRLKTNKGWVKSGNLKEGDFLACARKGIFGKGKGDIDLLKLYALLIGDGRLGPHDNSVVIGSIYKEFQEEIQLLCKRLGYRVREDIQNDDLPDRKRTAPIHYYAIYGDIINLLEKDGMRVKSREKHIPGWILKKSKKCLSVFLSYLFSTDGYVALNDRRNEIGYSTTSEKLARDIVFCLRKFGIIGFLRESRSTRRGKDFGKIWKIYIKNRDHIMIFKNEIGFFGNRHQEKLQAISYADKDRSKANGRDVIPVELTKDLVSIDVPASKKDGSSDIKKRLRGKTNRPAFQRETVREFAQEKDLDELMKVCDSDIYWDKIDSITPMGTHIGYDFEVEGNHNYIAGGIVSHNSYGARGLAFTLTWNIPITVVLIRSRLNTLKKNHIIPAKNELRDWIDEGFIRYNDKEKIFYMPSGGMVQFAFCAKDADIEQFDGPGTDLYIFEEASHFTKHQIDGIIKNNRASDIAINRSANYKPRSLFTFNWGGPGHQILRRWFWDKIYTEHERPEDFQFIFASLFQNQALLKANPQYVQNLKQLPKQLREAYLHGDPDAFVGTMFMVIPQFHEVNPKELLDYHNEESNERRKEILPETWRLVASLDAGIGAPCSFGLYAITPEGNLYKLFTYYYDPDIEGGKRSAPAHVKAIMERIESCKWTRGQHPEFIVADSYAFQKHNQMGVQAGDVTWEDLFAGYEIPLHQVKYNRITAIMALQTAIDFELDENNEELEVAPKLQFFEGYNDATIEEMRAAQRSKDNPEDMDPKTVDHAIDETKNMVLCAESPPEYVPLKSVPKVNRKADYGSKVDRLEEIQSLNDNYRETFRNAL